jgi:hypothetical protein
MLWTMITRLVYFETRYVTVAISGLGVSKIILILC